jgi:hypothetical protein
VKTAGEVKRAKNREKRHFLVTASLKPGHVLVSMMLASRCMHRTHKGYFVSELQGLWGGLGTFDLFMMQHCYWETDSKGLEI